jgi:hypothetical protein
VKKVFGIPVYFKEYIFPAFFKINNYSGAERKQDKLKVNVLIKI